MTSLFWKDWKENWPIIPASGVLSAVFFVASVFYQLDGIGRGHNHLVNASTFDPLFLLIWSIPAALCSASAIAPETDGRTVVFLATVPISRSKIWWTKTVAAFSMYVVSVAAAVLVFALAYSVTGSAGLLKSTLLVAVASDAPIIIVGLVFSLPIFAIGMLATVIANKAVNAILLLFGISSGCGIVIFALMNTVFATATDQMIPGGLLAGCFLCTLLFSKAIFTKGSDLLLSKETVTAVSYAVFDIAIVVIALWISYLLLTI